MLSWFKKVFMSSSQKNHTLEDLKVMDKNQLEQVGRQYGIELDRRKTHEKILKQLWKHIVKSRKK